MDWLLLVALCGLGIALGRMQTTARQAGRLDGVSQTVMSAVHPASKTLEGALDGVADFVTGIVSANDLVSRNRALEARVRAMEQYDERVKALTQDIDALRREIGLEPVAGRKKIAANVTMYFPYENRIVIDVGKKQGVWSGLPVVTADGLLGVVQVVEEHVSHVSLLSSPTLRVGAVTNRDPAPAGLLHGESSDVLIFELLDSKQPVETGDLVMTSGFSENIPRNIPIGRVVRLEDDREFGTRRAQVYPFAQIGNVREVFVLR
ncbi:MAG: rod shape-determining protein MreC [Fimbriimonadaceae bacterium]|nr:rod shape-determining protein MreC [Chthonomonadaceae bacterium]MCO5296166.1 rod shape-determining protein MreC [Fimbriimonadaceae bacterium]